MFDIRAHERFELEVLHILSTHGFLNKLIFAGGTCLRLCFGLNRYSIDLDFWQQKGFTKSIFQKMKTVFEKQFLITNFYKKHFSFLIELKSPLYGKKLKIEIRKNENVHAETELNIAYSPLNTIQVRLITFTLKQMWLNKVEAFLKRGEIRDAYDLEFLMKKSGGNFIKTLSKGKRQKMITLCDLFTKKDFKVRLGSLLESDEREYYNEYGFKVLKNALIF